MDGQQGRRLGTRNLYLGDLVGLQVKHEDGRDECHFGQVHEVGRPLDSLLEQEIKPHWLLTGAEFSVDWGGYGERTYERNESVNENVFILDRSFLQVGNRVRRPRCQGVTGRILSKELVATVVFENAPEDCLVVPLARLYKGLLKPEGQNFILGDVTGELAGIELDVTLSYPESDDACTCTMTLPSDGETALGLGKQLRWSRSKLSTVTWNRPTTILTRTIKQLAHANDVGSITHLNIRSGFPNWAVNVDTREAVTVNDKIPNFDEAMLFPPVPTTGHHGLFFLTLEGGDLTKILATTEFEDSLFQQDLEASPNKIPRLTGRTYVAEDSHPVRVRLVQTKVVIKWELNEQDTELQELFTCQLDDILDLSTAEIERPTFVVQRFPNAETQNLFGLVKDSFPGELELCPINPRLNVTNMKDVKWYKLDATSGAFIENHESKTSAYSLKPIDLEINLKGTIAVAESNSIGPKFIFGKFHRITETGNVELHDADGVEWERAPNLVHFYCQNGNFSISQILVEELHSGGSRTEVPDCKNFNFWLQCPRLLHLATCSGVDDVPIHSQDLNSLSQELWRIRQLPTGSNISVGTWFCHYRSRNDLISMIVAGETGTLMEDMIFAVNIHLPESSTYGPPVVLLNNWEGVAPYQAARLRALAQRPWRPGTSILDFFAAVRELLLMAPNLEDQNLMLEFQRQPFPLHSLYRESDLDYPEWRLRWNEVTHIQSIQLALKLMKPHPSRKSLLDLYIAGHYQRVLPTLLNRWKGWIKGTHSDGFKQTVAQVIAQLKVPETDEDGDENKNIPDFINDDDENEDNPNASFDLPSQDRDSADPSQDADLITNSKHDRGTIITPKEFIQGFGENRSNGESLDDSDGAELRESHETPFPPDELATITRAGEVMPLLFPEVSLDLLDEDIVEDLPPPIQETALIEAENAPDEEGIVMPNPVTENTENEPELAESVNQNEGNTNTKHELHNNFNIEESHEIEARESEGGTSSTAASHDPPPETT